MEAGHRPFVTEPEGSEDFFQDGDSPVGTSFGPGWRLDGVSRLERCVLASSDASGISQAPQVRSVRESVPVQGSLLWPVYGSTGFHTVHGSCFDFTSPIRHSSSSISRRLAGPGVLPGAGSPCFGHSSPALSLAQDCRQLGEVSADGVSGSSTGLYLFQGFSCPKECREASLSWRRILVLRRAASVILARGLRSTVFNDSARSGGTASDAVSSISPPSLLGSCRPDDPYPLDSRDPPGSEVVVESRSLGTRYFTRSGVPSARLVVRRLGHGLGAHLGQEVTSGLWSREEVVLSINARELLTVERALLFFAPRISNSIIALFADSSTAIAYLRNQGGTRSQLHFSTHSAVGGVSSGRVGSAIHYGSQQRRGGFPFQAQSDLRVGVDSEIRGVSGSAQEVAGVHRPFRNLVKKPTLPIFFSVPRSERAGRGCSAPELEWVAGVCLSSLISNSSCTKEAPVIIWSPPDHHSSLLASETLVPGASGSGSGRSCSSSAILRPSETASLPSSSGSVSAVSSCVETVQ